MDVQDLDGQPLFAGLSKKEREFVATHADEVQVDGGMQLIREGGLAWEFFVIVSGTAEVRHGDVAVATLGPGDFFGEIGAMSPGVRRTAGVVTTAPMTAIVMTSRELRSVAAQMPDVADRLRSAIAERTQRLDGAAPS